MDAQYTVLARRFRPQTFTEVVGQERVAQTLRNAIKEGRVAHAYLFTGARGVGKTSMARILAKALNCPFAKDGVPCNECEQCRGISVGQDVDVSEIDGASNRGIDDIRSLRANVNVKSMRSKYKIYIIDEVHMLTKEAFNALLKTLEEPPAMVKFIFCTTEANKVPDTILSRCQRFDFGTISTDNITIRLRQLAEAEGFKVDEAALELVARRAAGSMRDSQSLFDQLLAFGAEHITSADVHRLLGTAPDDRLTGLIDALIDRRRDEALKRLDLALREGVQLEAFTDQMVNYFRDLMVTACSQNSGRNQSEADDVPLLSVGMDCREILRRQSQSWGLQTITTAMQILSEAKGRMQRVTYGRALAELALVRISLLEDLDRLDDLIGQLKGGVVVAVATGASSRSTGNLTSSPPKPLAQPAPAVDSSEKKNDLASPAPVFEGATAQPASVTRSATIPTTKSTENGRPKILDSEIDKPEKWVASASSSPDLPKNEPIVGESPSTSKTPKIEWKSGCEKELQSLIADCLNDMTGTSVRRATPIAIFGPNLLEFSIPVNYDVERRTLDRPETISRIELIVSELVGRPIQVRFRTGEAVGGVAKPATPATSVPRSQMIENPDDPFLQNVMEVFGIKSWKVKDLPVELTEGEPREGVSE